MKRTSTLRLRLVLDDLAIVAVGVLEGGDQSAPPLLAPRTQELDALAFESRLLLLQVVDKEVDQHSLRLLGRPRRPAVPGDSDNRAPGLEGANARARLLLEPASLALKGL